jgi:hypothetical protein
VYDLSSADRTLLATAIGQCVTPEILTHHAMINHEYGPDILIHHRMLLREMEDCLTQSGASQFVPLPYWNPGEAIPPELRSVVQIGGSNYPPLVEFELWRSELADAARLETFTGAGIYWHPTLDDLANYVFVNWHNSVHNAVGGAMLDPSTSPAAVIFWAWHAYVDNIYAQWEQAHSSQ